MNEKLKRVVELTKDLIVTNPPGAFMDFAPSNITYVVYEKGDDEYLSDNPYILEYLLYNQKERLIPLITNRQYLGRLSKRNSAGVSRPFFTERLAYLLDFQVEAKELLVFTKFLEFFASYREKRDDFYLDPSTFLYLSAGVPHKMKEDEVLALYERIYIFHMKHHPRQALKKIFFK